MRKGKWGGGSDGESAVLLEPLDSLDAVFSVWLLELAFLKT